jgi:hypothetical protein
LIISVYGLKSSLRFALRPIVSLRLRSRALLTMSEVPIQLCEVAAGSPARKLDAAALSAQDDTLRLWEDSERLNLGGLFKASQEPATSEAGS